MCSNNRTSKRNDNCFICFFRPALIFGYTGITPINFHCDHSGHPVKCSLKRSWLGTSISAVLFIVVLFVGAHNAYTLYGTKISTREDVLLLGAVLINFIAAYLLSVGLRNANIKIRELRGIIQLVEDADKMGIKFLHDTFVKRGQTLTFTLITLFVCLQLFTIAAFFINGDFSFTAYKRLCTDTCVFLQGTLGTHYITLHLLLLNMFQKVLDKMKEILETRLDAADLNKNDSDSINSSQQIFDKEVRRICRFYKSIYLNLLEEDHFTGPALLIWWNAIVAANIVSVYVLLKSMMMQEPLGMVSILFMLKIYGCMMGVIIYLFEMEITAAVVSCLIKHVMKCN